MDDVTTSWNRIHAWLAAHAPKILANLNPPATEQQMADAEKVFGVEMPADWRSLYRTHNGMNSEGNFGSLFYVMQFLTLERAIEEFGLSSEPTENTIPIRKGDAGIRPENFFNTRWIPLAHDNGSTLLRVDLDPAPGGKQGQVIFTDHDDETVILLHGSVAELLASFANDLETGRYSLNEEALAEGDQFLNCDKELDVINWASSPRWKHLRY